ncbi:hypothetical protein MP638_006663 [Amoeboaphelidium occidentale]|nr:hypothetical protein MP638_006663 [Amoeboaphelidium occidentale]
MLLLVLREMMWFYFKYILLIRTLWICPIPLATILMFLTLLKKKAVAHDYLGFKYVTMSYLRSIQRRITSHEEQEQQTLELTVEGVLLHNQFQVLKKNLPSGRVIAFMNSAQLELILKYGNGVVFMDSTEKTNSKKYYYVTAVVRTDERKWMALFQFWTSSEHSELYEASLRWALEKSGSSWKPASFVIDGYRMEEKAVYSVFGNTVKIFNCTRHSLETLKTKVRQSAFVLENMKRALFASSYRECLNSWQEALSNCPYDEIGRYLPRAWPMERSHIWSVYPRQSGQWAEVTTSNPVESFFSRVKKVVNINMSLVEATNEIVKLLKGLFEQLNEQKEKEGVSCVVGVEKVHSSVSSWKMSNQRLILKEFEAAQKYVEEGILDSLYIQAQHDGACKCKFYRFN